MKVTRDAPIIYSDSPDIGGAADGHLYRFAYDHGPACDESLADGVLCRLPAGHDGLHLAFSQELVDQSGARVIEELV